jgi:hypothetical protein
MHLQECAHGLHGAGGSHRDVHTNGNNDVLLRGHPAHVGKYARLHACKACNFDVSWSLAPWHPVKSSTICLILCAGGLHVLCL